MFNLIYTAYFFAHAMMSWCKNETQDIFTGDISAEGNYITVKCYGQPLDKVTLPHLEIHYDIEAVYLVDCIPPETTYAEALSKISPILVEGIEITLRYKSLSTNISFDPKYFEGLNVGSLNIDSAFYNPMLQINSTDFLLPLKGLYKFSLSRVDCPPLPQNSELEYALFFKAKSIGAIGGCDYLYQLYLEEWDLEMIPEYWLANCSELVTLNLLDMINFSSDQLRRMLKGIPSLTTLTISGSDINVIPTEVLNNADTIQRLLIAGNNFNKLSLRGINMKSLEFLQLNDVFQLQGFPQIQTSTLTLDLSDNSVTSWNVTEADYEIFVQNKKLLILEGEDLELKLDCDCQHGWLVRVLHTDYLQLSPAECTDGRQLHNITREEVECNKFKCGDCTCREQWSDNTTVARCSGKASRVPRVRALQALHAAGNRIDMLSAHDLPHTLLFIDLRDNLLSNMDKNTTEALFSVSERRMRLGGNLFACNCDNYLLIEAFQTYTLQVEDYDFIKCIQGNEKKAVRDVILSDLCAKELSQQRQQILWTTLGVLAVLLGVAAVAGVVYWRYRQHIKVYLYARGYCMWCLREDDVDCDRLYDAFLSFSHHDELFVLQELLPRLDAEYKLCLHFRDWVLGDFIPAQITRSVEQSRRTIIVLSRNFLESAWGMLEFRTAHMSALEEGRARLIVVVLDDVVDDENLAPELRGYIKTNTYLRWGDKWFWQRLRYAMPRRLQLAESSGGRSPATPLHTLSP